jgi:type I restriction enzyme S subunit
MGQSPPSETYNTDGIGLPFYQGKAEFGELYPTPVKWCSIPGKVAEADDILISVRAPVGPTNLCYEKSCIGRGLAAIRPELGMNPRYFLYALRHIEPEWESKATGSTFSAISGDILRSQPIPLAPLAEQRRIVEAIEAQFTRLDAGIDALHRLKANLKRYKAAVLKAACEGRLVAQDPGDEPAADLLARILHERRAHWEADQRARGKDPLKLTYPEPVAPSTDDLPELPEGWVWASLDQIFDVERGRFSIRPRNDPRYYNGKYPFVQIGDLPREGGNITSYSQTLNEHGLNISRLFSVGTALIAIVGATIANTGILTFDSCAPDSLVALQSSLKVMVRYAELYLRSQKHIIRNFAYASGGQPNINLAVLKPYLLPLPPINEQELIIGETDKLLSVCEEIEVLIESNIRRAERLRHSILKQAFSGQLVPQDPADEPASELLKRIRQERPLKK